MVSNRAIARISFPKNWSCRVRSAVIQTISVAQMSLTHARKFAANSINTRIRLKTEINRLRQEIPLLREEGRIKDARMAQIPALRRPTIRDRAIAEAGVAPDHIITDKGVPFVAGAFRRWCDDDGSGSASEPSGGMEASL